MDAMDAIMTRRSIRKYADKKIPDDATTNILEAAMHAPSANNQQPWHFIVVDDKRTLKKIAEIHPYATMAAHASLAIIVCGDTEIAPDYWIQDCSAATQNILLAAHALGLGAVWCGIYPRQARVDAFRELLSIPDNAIPLAVIPMGCPAEERPKPQRYDESRVHRDAW